MKTFKDVMKKYNADIKNKYKKDLEHNKKNQDLHYLAYLIEKKWREFEGTTSILNLDPSAVNVSLYLAPYQTVAKDVMLFVEGIDKMVSSLTGDNYSITTDSFSVDFRWCKDFDRRFSIFFYYGTGNCFRKLVRVELTEQPIYEIVCN